MEKGVERGSDRTRVPVARLLLSHAPKRWPLAPADGTAGVGGGRARFPGDTGRGEQVVREKPRREVSRRGEGWNSCVRQGS